MSELPPGSGGRGPRPVHSCIGVRLGVWVLAWLLVGVAPVRAGEPVRIAVASNFRPAMAALVARFQRVHGVRIEPIYGSTGKHYAQIRHGAPFAAFLAADRARPERLEREGRALPGTRFTYALGRLVLWSPDPTRVDPGGTVLLRSNLRRLALANPDLAPYGAAARALLERLGLLARLGPRLVYGENVAQAFQIAYARGADAAFVALAQVTALPSERRGSFWLVPPKWYPPIEQQAVLLRDDPVARRFLELLRSEAGRALIRRHGYAVPEP